MQYSIATAITTILFASTLSSAAAVPRQAGSTVIVQFRNGDGDSSVQQTFAAGKLVTTTVDGLPITRAVNGEIVDSGDKCQFFSDAKGTQKIGGVLSSTDSNAVQFTDASTGGTGSVASQAVTLGSVFCASAAQFDSQSGTPSSASTSTSTSTSVSAPSASSQDTIFPGLTTDNSPSATEPDTIFPSLTSVSIPSASTKAGIFPVLIQINGLGEQASQGDILADGTPYALSAPLVGSDALSASIVHTHKAVECQAADAQGNALGGQFASGVDADFGVSTGVTVATITCTQTKA